MFWRRLLQPLRERRASACARQERLRRARDEYDRLRAELSHLEREIYDLWESDLPRPRKVLLESVLRVRARAIEDRMWDLSLELWRDGSPEIG